MSEADDIEAAAEREIAVYEGELTRQADQYQSRISELVSDAADAQARIAELEAAHSALESQLHERVVYVHSLIAERDEAQAEVERLRGEMRWFADPGCWVPSRSTTGHDVFQGWAGPSDRKAPWLRARKALTPPQPTPAKEDSGACGACGEKMTGEWMDGTELTCAECGVEVVAQYMTDGGWIFPRVYEEDEDE